MDDTDMHLNHLTSDVHDIVFFFLQWHKLTSFFKTRMGTHSLTRIASTNQI